jgi:hypothetical protein
LATVCHGKGYVCINFDKKMYGRHFWASFSQTHLVTLILGWSISLMRASNLKTKSSKESQGSRENWFFFIRCNFLKKNPSVIFLHHPKKIISSFWGSFETEINLGFVARSLFGINVLFLRIRFVKARRRSRRKKFFFAVALHVHVQM